MEGFRWQQMSSPSVVWHPTYADRVHGNEHLKHLEIALQGQIFRAFAVCFIEIASRKKNSHQQKQLGLFNKQCIVKLGSFELKWKFSKLIKLRRCFGIFSLTHRKADKFLARTAFSLWLKCRAVSKPTKKFGANFSATICRLRAFFATNWRYSLNTIQPFRSAGWKLLICLSGTVIISEQTLPSAVHQLNRQL